MVGFISPTHQNKIDGVNRSASVVIISLTTSNPIDGFKIRKLEL